MSKLTATAFRVLVLFCAGFVVSCNSGKSAESILTDYLRRVERSTDVDAIPTEPIALLTYPSHRQRTIPIEDIRIGILDYIKLYDCDLFKLINERNSVLGKVMPVSKKLVYEVNFLSSARDCYLKLQEKQKPAGTFRQALEDIIETKRANLAKVFWNATFDSKEMQIAFSLAVTPLAADDEVAFTNSRQAIDYFNWIGTVLTKPDTALDIEALETAYYTLQLHQYGGRLLQSVAQLAGYLNEAAYSLEMAIQDRPLCYRQKPNDKARILQTVFTKYYIGRVNGYLAKIYQQGKSWLTAIDQLIQMQQIELPGSFSAYRDLMLSLDKKGSLWIQFENAIHRHTKAWQAVLGQCGLMPGQSS